MFHGIFLRRMPSSSDSFLHSCPTHRTRCQMQTAIRPLFHSHRTFPLARLPNLRPNETLRRRLSSSAVDTVKKQALFRSKLVNFSPLPPHFSHAEAHFVHPCRPFTHAHTRTPSLFDFAFTLQANCLQNTDNKQVTSEAFTFFPFTPKRR